MFDFFCQAVDINQQIFSATALDEDLEVNAEILYEITDGNEVCIKCCSKFTTLMYFTFSWSTTATAMLTRVIVPSVLRTFDHDCSWFEHGNNNTGNNSAIKMLTIVSNGNRNSHLANVTYLPLSE